MDCEVVGTLFPTTSETFRSKSRCKLDAADSTCARLLLYENDDDVYFEVAQYLL